MTTTGGLCAYGPCRTAFVVTPDGGWRRTENDAVVAEGRLSDDDRRGLAEAIERSAIVAGPLPPFVGTCPTASDGPELTYEFTVRAITHRAASCKQRIPGGDPGTRALIGLRDRVSGGR